MIIASAQIKPFNQDIERNIETHIRFIEQAVKQNADFIIFPEMSLTGYLRETAKEFSFTPRDERLMPLKELVGKYKITVVVGAPVFINNKLFIASFILLPNGAEQLYTKQYLHDGEEVSFSPSFEYNPTVENKGEKIALAICADIENPEHPKAALNNNATIYGASIFYSAGGIDGGLNKLATYAKQYNMPVVMSDFCGNSYGIKAGGKSSFWDESGNLIGQLNSDEEGMLVVEKSGNDWRLLNS